MSNRLLNKTKKIKNRQSLNERAPKLALPFATRTSAIVTVCVTVGQKPQKKVIKLSERLKNVPLALAIIFGLQDRPDKSAVTAYSRTLSVQNFLTFLINNLVDGESPVDIFRLFVNELNQKVLQRTVQCQINNLAIPLKHAIDEPRFMDTLDADQQWLVRRIFSARPSISRSPGKARAGMGELFENLADDRSLFDGVRDYASWAMLELQAHRDELLQSKDVQQALSDARRITSGDVNALKYESRNARNVGSNNPSNLCSAIFKAVYRSNSNSLKERLLLGLEEYRSYLSDVHNKIPATRLELDSWLELCIKGNNKGFRPTSLNTILLKFDQCDLRSLLEPTDAECVCLQWLLASLSVQPSGQQRAQIGNYIIHSRSMYFKHDKQRSKTKRKDTDPISKTSNIGKAISGFIKVKEKLTANGRLLEKQSYLSKFLFRTPRWRFLLAATFESSNVRKSFLQQFPQGIGFLALLTKLRIHGDKYSKYKNECSMLYTYHPPNEERARRIKELKQKMTVTEEKTLNCEAIRKTRISLQDVIPGQSAISREIEENAIATSNGHTVEVFRTIYRNRDRSRYRLKRRAEFASAVGELMVILSEKVRAVRDSNEILLPDDVANAIGLERGFESEDERVSRLFVELEIQGYQLNYFGAATKGNRRIIIETPITVALLLDAQKSYLEIAGKKDTTDLRIEEAALEYALLEIILDKMSKRIVDQGKSLYEKLTLPPHIMVGVEK